MAIKRGLRNNTQPLALLRSWLRYIGLPFSEGLAPPTDLVVGQAPRSQTVHVTTGAEDVRPRLVDPPGLNLDGLRIYRGTPEEAIQEFHVLLRRMGIPEALPFERGTPTQGDGEPLQGRVKRRRDGDDLILFRHDKFRRAPNPTADQVALYDNVVGMATKVYWRRNRWMLEKMLMEYDELLSYAWVWATIFMAHYELPNARGEENQRLLHAFLQQQFHELRRYQRRRHEDFFVERAFHTQGGLEWTDPSGSQEKHVIFKADLERAFGMDPVGGRRRGKEGGIVVVRSSEEVTSRIVNRLDLRDQLNDILVHEEGALEEVDNPADYFSEREVEREANKVHFLERLLALPPEEAVSRLEAAANAEATLDFNTRRVASRYLERVRGGSVHSR